MLHLQQSLRERITEDNELLEKRIKKMKDIIEILPPKCKKIIKLNKIDGKKYSEIAELMNISVKTVESQMRIAFNKIRKAFKDDKMVLFMLLNSIQTLKENTLHRIKFNIK